MLEICPNNYRATFKKACHNLDDKEKACQDFIEIYKQMKEKEESRDIQPLEIEYYYKCICILNNAFFSEIVEKYDFKIQLHTVNEIKDKIFYNSDFNIKLFGEELETYQEYLWTNWKTIILYLSIGVKMANNKKIDEREYGVISTFHRGIVYEERKNFSKSVFEKVYKRAYSLVQDSVSLQILKEDTDNFDEASDNIIIFVGRRGTGKSSAMLSLMNGLCENCFQKKNIIIILSMKKKRRKSLFGSSVLTGLMLRCSKKAKIFLKLFLQKCLKNFSQILKINLPKR